MIRSTSCGLTEPTISCWPTETRSPSPTSSRARRETVYDSSSEPSSGVTTSLRDRSPSSIRTRPSTSEIGALPFGMRASNSSCTRGRPCVMSSPATPPVWKVRMVSWVPGSPMDCAAMMPTASPTSTSRPVASDRP